MQFIGICQPTGLIAWKSLMRVGTLLRLPPWGRKDIGKSN